MVCLTVPISADNVLLSYLSNLDVTEMFTIFCLHTLRKVAHFFVNELSNINDIGINFKRTHADRKWITLSKQFSLTVAQTYLSKWQLSLWQNVLHSRFLLDDMLQRVRTNICMKLNSFHTTFQGLFTNKPQINKRHSKHSHPKQPLFFSSLISLIFCWMLMSRS